MCCGHSHRRGTFRRYYVMRHHSVRRIAGGVVYLLLGEEEGAHIPLFIPTVVGGIRVCLENRASLISFRQGWWRWRWGGYGDHVSEASLGWMCVCVCVWVCVCGCVCVFCAGVLVMTDHSGIRRDGKFENGGKKNKKKREREEDEERLRGLLVVCFFVFFSVLFCWLYFWFV